MVPETRYVKAADGVHIAYQVLGEGPNDLVFVPGFVFNVEDVWQTFPEAAAFLRRLSAFSRTIIFDRRGTGLSDHIVRGERQLTLEARMDDIRAVMDALGSTRAALFGFEDGLGLCAMFAGTYPDRTVALISYAGVVTWRRSSDFPWGFEEDELETWLGAIDRGWGTLDFARWWGEDVWPDIDDPDWFVRYATAMRRAVSPGDALSLLRIDFGTDARGLFPAIRVPTLVLHRTDDKALPVEQARYLSDQIPGAVLKELPGTDHGWVSPSQEDVLDEVERFLRGLREEEAELDRVLATVLFTDIVGSTARAAELGDRVWAKLVERHHGIVRAMLARYRGREVDTAGDGFLATFDGPARAVRCAQAIVDAVRSLQLEIRAGIHTGEIELADGGIRGIAVHIGARVAAVAAPSEVLVSSTVRDLVAGSGIAFEDRGERELKGVPERWRLYRVVG